MMVNLYAAWIGVFLGCLAGAIPGLYFHGSDWLGGYTSWPRRMIRLAHVSFFGIGLLNLALALTTRSLGLEGGIRIPSILLLVGAMTMPAVCYLSAWKPTFRHVFFIPVMCVTFGIGIFAWRLLAQ